MSRHYPLWFKVTNCNYESSKSFGGRNTIKQEVLVGSSAKNSNHFCDIKVTRRKGFWKEKSVWIFRVSIDDTVIKI